MCLFQISWPIDHNYIGDFSTAKKPTIHIYIHTPREERPKIHDIWKRNWRTEKKLQHNIRSKEYRSKRRKKKTKEIHYKEKWRRNRRGNKKRKESK